MKFNPFEILEFFVAAAQLGFMIWTEFRHCRITKNDKTHDDDPEKNDPNDLKKKK